MNNHTFLSKPNIDLVWDVIIDEDIVKQCSSETHAAIYSVFCNNIQPFFDNEYKSTPNLVDMNKKYIMLMLNFISKNISTQPQPQPQQQQQQQQRQEPPKQIIKAKQPITRDDIQTDKRTQIEREFDMRQKDFTNAMTIPVPPVPNFNDEMDLPIGEMEEAIRIMTEQRKYDTDQFNKGYTETNGDWLKPAETSIKNEKFKMPLPPQQQPPQQQQPKPVYKGPPPPIQSQQQQQSIKYIKIDNTDLEDNKNYVIDLPTNISPKHISWSDEQQQQQPTTMLGINDTLFKKLKRLEQPSEVEILKQQVDMLQNKIEFMNQNIVNILEILNTK